VADWPVFLSSSMHHDIGDLFAVGDTMSWNVELIDGHAAGWPGHVLADVMVTIRPRPGQRWLDRRAAEGLQWARWAVRRWSGFPVGRTPRPLVPAVLLEPVGARVYVDLHGHARRVVKAADPSRAR
jgi:hypothetical protein